MAEFFSKDGELDPGMIIRRVLFLLLLIGLGIYHLFFNFRGLTHERGMDQAQIAREIAAHNTFNTKFLRPLTIFQVNKFRDELGPASPTNFADVFHAPLNPLLNSVALRFFRGEEDKNFTFDPKSGSSIYILDRVIAAVSMLLFLSSIFISYLLVSRIFDTKIAGVSALMILFCSLMWDFTQTGMPQMLMLFLFSFGLYFLFKAIETQEEETPPFVWVALAAGFFGLLALTHWLAIWLFFGLLLFSALYFRPKGVMAILLIVIFSAIVAAWGFRNYKVCGDVFGSGIYSLKSGLAEGNAEDIFRNFNPEQQQFDTRGLFSKIVVNSLTQLENFYAYIGALVTAPLFFLSLLHPFKRKEIANFRWCILSMWVFAVIGMTIYGIPEGKIDPNQLHILFAPIMTAYGLAFLTVVWNRIGFETNHPLVTQGHLVIVTVISAIPLLLPLPKNLRNGIILPPEHKAVFPNYYPPYMGYVSTWTTDTEVILSDIPWAMAWYGNRASMWLPKEFTSYEPLNDYVEKTGRRFAGIFISPRTGNAQFSSEIMQGRYKGWREAIVHSQMDQLGKDQGSTGYNLLPEDFPFPEWFGMNGFNFFSDTPRWRTSQ